MKEIKWSRMNPIRWAIEELYQHQVEAGTINIPKYDLFVTQLRGDWERAGFDLEDPADLYKLWGALNVTCAASAYMLQECKTAEQLKGAVKVCGTYGNMVGLFLREMSRYVADVPAPVGPTNESI